MLATFLYDEVILKGKPASHVADEALKDPMTKKGATAMPDHLREWLNSCSDASEHLPYSLDYRTWLPNAANILKPPDELTAFIAKKALKLDDIRAEVDKVVKHIGDAVHSKEGKKLFTTFKALVEKSSTGPLSALETSQVRVAAYGIMGDFCSKDDAKKITTLRWDDIQYKCKRDYVSTHASQVPLSSRRFAELVRDNDGKTKTSTVRCHWDYSKAKCMPRGSCKYQLKFGDRHLTHSCRTTVVA